MRIFNSTLVGLESLEMSVICNVHNVYKLLVLLFTHESSYNNFYHS